MTFLADDPSTTPSPPTLLAPLLFAHSSRRPNTAASSRQHASPSTSAISSPTSDTLSRQPSFFCDNEVAIGLANRTVCLKKSKSLDVRFHWLRDRIDQGQFRVLFVPGKKNLADFFTKALPVARHKAFAPFFAIDDDSTGCIDLRLSTILFVASLFTPRAKRVC
jgi:hypothetical protein